MFTLKDLWCLLDFGLERVELAQASEKGFFIPLFVLVPQGHQGKDWQTMRRGF